MLFRCLACQVLSIMYLRMQSVEQDRSSVDDVGDTSAGVATDVIVTLVLAGVNCFVVLMCVLVWASATALGWTRAALHVA